MLKDFQEQVKREEGYVLSDGTLCPLAILCKVYDFLEDWGIVYELDGIRKAIGLEEGVASARQAYYYDELINPDEGDAEYIWQDEVTGFLDYIAPKGYYFGNIEGDWSHIGWFKIEGKPTVKS